MRTIYLLLLLFIPCLSLANNSSLSQNFYKVGLASVYDGDTFKVYLACRYHLFCKKIAVRVKGIDAPELKTKDPCEKQAAIRARQFTKDFLTSGPIILRNCQKDKYFRLLCDVFVRDIDNPTKKHEKSLSQAILAENLAVPYDGGTKQAINWCEKIKNEK